MTAVLQSVLDPAGPQAAHISWLWWLMFWVTTAVFVVVFALVLASVWRGGRAQRAAEDQADKPLVAAVSFGVALTVVILFGLLGATMWTHRAVLALGAESAVTVNVTGHQFWWEFEYDDAVPSQRFHTANELHIPVGRPVVLKVTSRDVIHSFWVPNLHGKRDLIPGYTTAIWIQADKPGLYRGQCAEFCGLEHARMALYVTAESNTDFEKWRMNQQREAPAPSTDDERRGRDTFLRATCTQCHPSRGAIAGGAVGRDRTHLAAPGAIAAGRVPDT